MTNLQLQHALYFGGEMKEFWHPDCWQCMYAAAKVCFVFGWKFADSPREIAGKLMLGVEA